MDRLIKSGIITSIIGLVIIAFTGLLIYKGKAGAAELGGWLSLAILFLRSRDTIIGIDKEKNKSINE